MRGRARRWGAAVLACLVGGYAAALLVYNPLTLSLFGGSDAAVPLADFGSFYASGLAARQGLDPYGVYPLTMDANPGRGAAVNINAPVSVVVFEGLTVLEPVSGRRVWFVATLVAYGLMLGLLAWQHPGFRRPLFVAWALLLTGFIETVLLGQVYALLALLSTTAWVLLQDGGAASLRSLPPGGGRSAAMRETTQWQSRLASDSTAQWQSRMASEPPRRLPSPVAGRLIPQWQSLVAGEPPWRWHSRIVGGLTRAWQTSRRSGLRWQWRWLVASALIGIVVAFKPNFLLWPGLLLLAGYWRVAVASVVAAVGFGAIPAVLEGPGVYAEWLSALRFEQVNSQVANASLPGLLARDGAATPIAVAAGALVAIGLAIWVWRRRPDTSVTSGVALVGLLLASPVAWVGYTVFLLPVVARSRLTVALVVACALLCVPRLGLQAWADDSVWLGLSLGAAYTLGWSILLLHAASGKS